MAYVFISYARQDIRIATLLSTSLEKAGVPTFHDVRSIQPGDDWKKTLLQQMKESRAVIYLASRASLASTTVQAELGMAVSARLRILPILIDITPEQLPALIRDYQAVSLLGMRGVKAVAQIEHVVATIAADKSRDDARGVAVMLGLGLAMFLLARE